MICLATPRLLLRTWRPEDLEPYIELCADPDVMRHIGDGRPKSADETRTSFDRIQSEWDRCGYGLFALELLDTGAFIGFTGMSEPWFLPQVMPAVEVGWRLRADHWNQGYATEAAHAVVDWAFGSFDLQRLIAIVAAANTASARVAGKVGMNLSNRMMTPSGRWVDIWHLDVDSWRDADG